MKYIKTFLCNKSFYLSNLSVTLTSTHKPASYKYVVNISIQNRQIPIKKSKQRQQHTQTAHYIEYSKTQKLVYSCQFVDKKHKYMDTVVDIPLAETAAIKTLAAH